MHRPRARVAGRGSSNGGDAEGRRNRRRPMRVRGVSFGQKGFAGEDTGGRTVRCVQPPQRAVRGGHQQVKAQVPLAGTGEREKAKQGGRCVFILLCACSQAREGVSGNHAIHVCMHTCRTCFLHEHQSEKSTTPPGCRFPTSSLSRAHLYICIMRQVAFPGVSASRTHAAGAHAIPSSFGGAPVAGCASARPHPPAFSSRFARFVRCVLVPGTRTTTSGWSSGRSRRCGLSRCSLRLEPWMKARLGRRLGERDRAVKAKRVDGRGRERESTRSVSFRRYSSEV